MIELTGNTIDKRVFDGQSCLDNWWPIRICL